MYTEKLEEMIHQYKGLMGIVAWLDFEKMKVYFKVTQQYINGKFYKTLDISSVVTFEEYQNQGVFKEFLKTVEELATKYNKTVFVECVHNEILASYLEKVGYQTQEHAPINYYKHFS